MSETGLVLSGMAALTGFGSAYAWLQSSMLPTSANFFGTDVGGRPEDISLLRKVARSGDWNRRAALLSACVAACASSSWALGLFQSH